MRRQLRLVVAAGPYPEITYDDIAWLGKIYIYALFPS